MRTEALALCLASIASRDNRITGTGTGFVFGERGVARAVKLEKDAARS